ncbi:MULTISPECIES: hypothetical protein [Eisenbergiella]|uniref:Uncharacterized protein n=1 Tax=Eisenbergiella porci TaxID=2652274 RepID=A0A6N7WE27_9FIRM|nr:MULTISPECIES: hypothetical protein [Eisenbergiella]MDY2652784.1 hypothetical protein [Eisenbergiella porci]MSS87995.1 hypothetical protein [Eisenbergiella porci]
METEVWNARELSQEEVISTLGNRFEVSYGKAASELFAFMDEAENEFSLKQVKQIPFCWDVFRSRPQRRYSLASRIIREIIHGSYPAGSYLPSLPHMAGRRRLPTAGVGLWRRRKASSGHLSVIPFPCWIHMAPWSGRLRGSRLPERNKTGGRFLLQKKGG